MESSLKLNKSGFAFSILSLFLVFLIFAFGSLYLFQEEFTSDAEYRESRIIYINDEIDYFKKNYIKSSLSFSLYNTFNELVIYLNSTNNFSLISQNPEMLDKLIFEGLTNGSFQGNNILNLDGKTIFNLTEPFKQNFEDSYRGNFTYEILNLTVFETQSYFIEIQIVSKYKVETFDKLSSWNFIDENIIQVPTVDLIDPEFLIQGGKNVLIKPSEFHISSNEWTHDTFNETLLNQYSTVFYKSEYDYTLGQSYLQRILNTTYGGFYGVIGQYTFDHDNLERGIYDNAQELNLGSYFGDTQILNSFDNSSRLGNNFTSLIHNQNPVQIIGSVDCSKLGVVYQNFCTFNDSSQYMEINASAEVVTFKENFSTSIWVNFKEDMTTNQTLLWTSSFKTQILYSAPNEYHLGFTFNSTSGSQTITSNKNLSPNTWYHLVTSYYTYNSTSGTNLTFYIDGSNKETFSANTTTTQKENKLLIGKSNITNENLNGSIDELGIYSRTLTEIEASSLYQNKKTYQIDYIDTEFDKGIEFDGVDDYLTIPHSNSLNFGTNNFSICIWFKTPEEFGQDLIQQLLSKKNITTMDGNFEIEINSLRLSTLINHIKITSPKTLEEDKYYFTCLVRDTNASLYLNGELENTTIVAALNVNSNNDVYIGKDQFSGQKFKGIIDEIKIYNRSLSQKEIKLNYKNYKSFGKGCCNYVTLVNQNKLGYNAPTTYNDKVSSSSSIFFNHYIKNIPYDVTLWNSTNFTSSTNTQDYYNLLLDDCMAASYNFVDYDPEAVNMPPDLAYNPGISGTESCSNLIKKGLY